MKVGRNDPCPCGSGKKYKKCCEQKTFIQKKTFTNLTSVGPKAVDNKITGMVSKALNQEPIEVIPQPNREITIKKEELPIGNPSENPKKEENK